MNIRQGLIFDITYFKICWINLQTFLWSAKFFWMIRVYFEDKSRIWSILFPFCILSYLARRIGSVSYPISVLYKKNKISFPCNNFNKLFKFKLILLILFFFLLFWLKYLNFIFLISKSAKLFFLRLRSKHIFNCEHFHLFSKWKYFSHSINLQVLTENFYKFL